MQIKFNKRRQVLVGDLFRGDCFIDGGRLFMRVKEHRDLSNQPVDSALVINLMNNKLTYFNLNAMVEQVEMELHVKGIKTQ